MPTQPAPESPQRRFAENIVRRIVEQHHIAYFAGGCVRDDLIGIPPADYDVATSATPEQVRQIFGPHRTLLVGAAFGVVCVHQRLDGILHQVEVATFRSDGEYSDGRRPDRVDYTTPERDALRRDFTINGLFYDPIAGQVIDFVGGQADLEQRLLRAIGDPQARFSEDKLRLLRAVRIAARFGLAIEDKTQTAIRAMAEQIDVVSPERIAAEMRKMLQHPSRATAIERLDEFGLLRAVYPDFAEPIQDPATRQMTLSRLASIEREDFVASLAVLCLSALEPFAVDESRPAMHRLVTGLKTRWRLSNLDAAALEFSLVNAPTLLASNEAKWSSLQPLLVSPFVQHALTFASALLVAAGKPRQILDRCRSSLALPIDELNPPPLVDGHLLMSLGLPTGPDYARLIKLGRGLQLDGVLRTRDEAMAWVRRQRQEPL